MKRNVNYLVILLLISLSVGFAALTTSLLFNGEVTLLANADDFDVVFTETNASDNGFSYISPDGTTLTYVTQQLTKVGDEAVLHYTVTNNSREFDANVDLNISDESGNSFDSDYVSIENTVPLKSTIDAKESSNGVLTVKLLKASDKDMTLDFKLTIDADSVERDKPAEDSVDNFNFEGLEPGLYDENNLLLASWDELVNNYGLDVSSDTEVVFPEEEPPELTNLTKLAKIDKFESLYSLMSIMVPNFGRVKSEHALANVMVNNEELQAGRTLVIGNDVKKIGAYALAFSNKLINISVPSSVTEIGAGAFTVCKNLVNVQLDSNVSTIPNGLFLLDSKIDDLVIPEGVTEIKDNAFGFAKIKNLHLPSTLNTLSSDFFDFPTLISNIEVNSGNPNYSSIDGVLYDKTGTSLIYYPSNKKDSTYTFPTGVQYIYPYAISYNSSLKHIIFNSSLNINYMAISNNNGLEDITFNGYIMHYADKAISNNSKLSNIFAGNAESSYHDKDGILYKGDVLVYYPDGRKDESFTPDAKTKKIGENAFYYTLYLKNLILNDGLETIESEAIQYSNMETIYIPSSVSSIEYRNFRDCKKIKEFNVSPENKNYKSIDGVPYTIDGKQIIHYPAGRTDEEYTVLDGVTTITLDGYLGTSVFDGNEYIKTINLPSSITTIDGMDYRYLEPLENINISDDNPNYCSVDGIVYSKDKTILIAYPRGRSATEFTVPSSVTKIDKHVFDNEKHLNSVILPNGLISIEMDSFYSMKSLTSITIPSSVTSIKTYAFASSGLNRVYFENPNGWQYNGGNLDATELSDPAKAAEYLVKSKKDYDWKRY